MSSCSQAIGIICFVSLTILSTVNGSSYAPCSTIADCKAAAGHEFRFECIRAQNRFTEERLKILENAAGDLMGVVFADPAEREEIQKLSEAIHASIQELETPKSLVVETTQSAAKNADRLWHQIFESIGETNNLRYYEKLIERKIDFFNKIRGIWRSSSSLMRLKTDEDIKEVEEIKKEFEGIGKVSSLLGSEQRMKKLVERISKLLNIEF